MANILAARTNIQNTNENAGSYPALSSETPVPTNAALVTLRPHQLSMRLAALALRPSTTETIRQT